MRGFAMRLLLVRCKLSPAQAEAVDGFDISIQHADGGRSAEGMEPGLYKPQTSASKIHRNPPLLFRQPLSRPLTSCLKPLINGLSICRPLQRQLRPQKPLSRIYLRIHTYISCRDSCSGPASDMYRDVIILSTPGAGIVLSSLRCQAGPSRSPLAHAVLILIWGKIRKEGAGSLAMERQKRLQVPGAMNAIS